MINSSTPILSITILAKELEIHPRTLRIYNSEKILCPIRTKGKMRLYSHNDVKKGKLILFLTRNLALNLQAVKILLKIMEENNMTPKEYLDKIKQIALDAGLDEISQQKKY